MYDSVHIWIFYTEIIIICYDKDDKDEEEITQDDIEEEIDNGIGIVCLPPGKVRGGKKGIKKGTKVIYLLLKYLLTQVTFVISSNWT